MTKTINIHNGWLSNARRVLSPNCNERPTNLDGKNPTDINLLVIHNISLPPGEFGGGYVESFFQNQLDPDIHPYFASIADLQVSAHAFIARTGEIVQFVSFNDRAWHAGVSSFEGRDQCNDYSIGIELEGTDTQAYTAQQYASLTEVTKALFVEYPDIVPTRIVGHCDIAPGRKTDPGDAFEWEQYRQTVTN